MRLKIFDLYEVIEDIDDGNVNKVMNELKEYCLYVPDQQGMAIYLDERKQDILNVIQRHAKELNLKARIRGNFVNLTSQLISDNVDWGDLVVGGKLVDSQDFWTEVVSLIAAYEDQLLESTNFCGEWNRIKKEALKSVLDKWYKQQINKIQSEYDSLINEWGEMESVPLL
ncbi:hypothetical protein JOD82_002262 [Paenibacillus sp. 1182]|uniref:hypothetical protein n=1 Tax=Paenibacillus sp. 1182 TaxID=2806565 RepID=UPI001AEA0513|nr:hypothetical protein [Paenibacillus sp. 1182]MBP1309242.1 hypothetical protein [Paenibacillus sp. 1182]